MRTFIDWFFPLESSPAYKEHPLSTRIVLFSLARRKAKGMLLASLAVWLLSVSAFLLKPAFGSHVYASSLVLAVFGAFGIVGAAALRYRYRKGFWGNNEHEKREIVRAAEKLFEEKE